jgi:hypothetical protein
LNISLSPLLCRGLDDRPVLRGHSLNPSPQ